MREAPPSESCEPPKQELSLPTVDHKDVQPVLKTKVTCDVIIKLAREVNEAKNKESALIKQKSEQQALLASLQRRLDEQKKMLASVR